MQHCERCGSTRSFWLTPSRFGRRAGIFQCLACQKLNVCLPVRRPRLVLVPVRENVPPIVRRRAR